MTAKLDREIAERRQEGDFLRLQLREEKQRREALQEQMAKAKLATVVHATMMAAQALPRLPNSVHKIPQTDTAKVNDTLTAAIASGSAETTLGKGNKALHCGNETGPSTMRARTGNANCDNLSVQPVKSYASAARDNGENRDPNSEGMESPPHEG
ncbi:hypothetical protein MTO96_043103 [Rhipicephalus appendiculatus]